MPPLTVRPTQDIEIESLSADSAGVRATLERNLISAVSLLLQQISERCTLTVTRENYQKEVSQGKIVEATGAIHAVFASDEEKRWLVRGSIQDSVEGRKSLTKHFETTFDPTDPGPLPDSNVPWDTQVMLYAVDLIIRAAHPLREQPEFFPENAKFYFDSQLSLNEESYSYVGRSEIFGRDSVRYEYRVSGTWFPWFPLSSEETEVLLVMEFLVENPRLDRFSIYQGPVDSELDLIQMHAVTQLGVESC